MKTIGVVGGIASGKSLVANMLAELGAGLLDGDRIGHALLAEDAEVRNAIQEHWGDAVFAADGSIDRSAVAKRVFSAGETAHRDRRFLEGLLHPKIRRRFEALRQQFADEGKPAVVFDAAVLFEAGWDPLCDIVLLVDAPRELRLDRARRRGWSDQQFDQREHAQWPIEKKRSLATVVIQNDGSEDQLRRAVHDFWQNRIAAHT